MQIKQSKVSTYGLILVLIVAALLRLYKVDQPFIDAVSWRQSDTATIADNFYQGNWNIFYPKVSWNGPGDQVVGYEFQTITYLAALLYRIVGHHDWVGRLIAIAFGVWGVFAFYQLIRRVWNEKHAVVGAAVLAVLPGSVYVDRSFLPDPVMLSLVITSVWLLLAYLQSDLLHYLILASLTGMLGFLTKVSGLIVVSIPMLYAIVAILSQKQRLRSKQLVLIIVAGSITVIPVIAYYVWAIYLSRTYPPYYAAAGEYWVWKFGLLNFLERYYFLPKLFSQLRWFWTLPIILLTLIGLFLRPPASQQIVSAQNSASQAPWLFHAWMLGFGLYYAIAAQGLVINATNLNLANPAAAALTALSLMKIATWVNRVVGARTAFALMVAMLLVLGGLGQRALHGFAFRPWAEDGYKLGLALRQVSQPDDLVVTIASTPGDTVAVYYSQRRGWVFPPVKTWPEALIKLKDDEGIRLLEDLMSKRADWFGFVQPQQFASGYPKLFSYIEQNFDRYLVKPEFVIYRIRA